MICCHGTPTNCGQAGRLRYVINALQFIGVIEEDGRRTAKGHKVFVLSDAEFPKAFAGLVRDAYKDLFDLRGDEAWTLSKADLVAYFRTTDKTSDVVGGRQASVFQAFCALAGYEQGMAPKAKPSAAAISKAKNTKPAAPKRVGAVAQDVKTETSNSSGKANDRRDMALTVRIEINLPAEGSRETYDNIFQSIKANLLNE